MIGGDIDPIFGVIGIFLAVGLGYVALSPPSPRFNLYTFGAVTGTLVLFPFMRHALNQRGLRAVDVEDVEKAYEILKARPDNHASRFKIARLIYELGLPGHAMRIAERCLEQSPKTFFEEERRMVQRWHWVALPQTVFHAITCSECGYQNPPGDVFCERCRAPFLLNRLRRKIMPSALGKKLMGAWIAMVAALAGIPYLSEIGGPLAIAGIIALMALSLGVLAMAFWPRDEGLLI
jgi:hypothetical protein